MQLAAALIESSRSTDIVSRLGGDEIALLLPGCSAQILTRRSDQLLGEIRSRTFVRMTGGWWRYRSVAGSHMPPPMRSTSDLYAARQALTGPRNWPRPIYAAKGAIGDRQPVPCRRSGSRTRDGRGRRSDDSVDENPPVKVTRDEHPPATVPALGHECQQIAPACWPATLQPRWGAPGEDLAGREVRPASAGLQDSGGPMDRRRTRDHPSRTTRPVSALRPGAREPARCLLTGTPTGRRTARQPSACARPGNRRR